MANITILYIILILLMQGRVLCAQAANTLYHHPADSIVIESLKEFPEPILIDETLPNEVGEWNMRFNFDYLKNDMDVNITLPEVQVFFGILRNLGGEISIPFIYRKEVTANYGLGSISTTIKWLIIKQSSKIPAVVLGFEVGFPTSSLSVESVERAFEYSPYIAFLKEVGHLCVQGNLVRAIEFPVSGGEKKFRTEMNVAFSYPALNEKVDMFIELNSSWLSGEKDELYVSPGIKYYLTENHFLALALPVELNYRRSFSRIIFQYQLLF